MIVSAKAWDKYLKRLRLINDEAVNKMLKQLENVKFDNIPQRERQKLIEYAYNLTRKYGEASAAVSCEMYDAIAELSGVAYAPAEPAATATYHEVAKAVNGTIKTGNKNIVAQAVGRLVKMTGVDTTMKNAIRDGAEWAWIPHGDTCAFCIMLASNDWQRASKKALRNGHAEHIHANCDCTYAVRFNSNTNVAGYKPAKYKKMYEDAKGDKWREKVRSMRRGFYDVNTEKIDASDMTDAQKSAARNASSADEFNVDDL